MKRTHLFAAGAALLAVVLAAASWFANGEPVTYTGPPKTITIGMTPAIYSLLLVTADECGFFKKNGLEVQFRNYQSGRMAVNDLMQGRIDIATAAEFVFVNESLHNDELSIIASIATSSSEEIVADKDKGISVPTDLKGRRIGVSLHTSAEFTLMRFLLFNHIMLKEVTLVDLAPAALADALANGSVDAIISWDYYIYEAKTRLGEKALSWPARIGQGFYWLLIADKAYIRGNGPALSRLIKALLEAENKVAVNPSEAQLLMARRENLAPEFVASEWAKNRYILSLDQGLIIAMEGEAEWRIQNDPAIPMVLPNYLRFIHMDSLNAVKPEANTIFR